MKETEKKSATKRVAAKKPAEKKTAGTKPAAKKPVAKKATEKKPAAKKAAGAKKPSVKAAEPKIVLQYGDLSVDRETIERNVDNYLAYERNMPASDRSAVEIYVKPEEGRAYVVVNGNEEGSILL